MDSNSTGDWNRTNELLIQSQVQRPATATPAYYSSKALRPGIEPDLRASKARVATTRRREYFQTQSKSVLRESNPPSRTGSPGPLPLGQGHVNLQSAQWESNPHFRHGKAAGYRYIMGAKMHHYQIVKDQNSY